jgi:DNA-directed RNA polymerase specialized sigma24 family protein
MRITIPNKFPWDSGCSEAHRSLAERIQCSSGDAAKVPAGIFWQRLREELTVWLLSRVRRGVDAENIAGDAVLLALRRFGLGHHPAVGAIWGWLCKTALHRVYYDHRKALRCALIFSGDVDAVQASPCVEEALASRVVDHMVTGSSGVDHRVLKLLQAGSPTNRDMAETLGVDCRTIERARARLRRRFAILIKNRSKSVGLEHL